MRSLAVAFALACQLGNPSRLAAQTAGVSSYSLVTYLAHDAFKHAIAQVAVKNVDSLMFAELKLIRRDGRFSADSAVLAEQNYRRMVGLSLRIVASERWMTVSAEYPGVVTISITATAPSGFGSLDVRSYGDFSDTTALVPRPN